MEFSSSKLLNMRPSRKFSDLYHLLRKGRLAPIFDPQQNSESSRRMFYTQGLSGSRQEIDVVRALFFQRGCCQPRLFSST